MSRKSMRMIMVLLSSAYGVMMGILSIAHVPGLVFYAIVGAALLGLGWTASSLLGNQQSGTPR
jgi:hypothetical protein